MNEEINERAIITIMKIIKNLNLMISNSNRNLKSLIY